MPPKVQDTHPQADQNHALEEETSRAARRIVATYAQDFLDGVTLMSMLGVEPKGLVHKKVLAEQADAAPKKSTKKSSKSPRRSRLRSPPRNRRRSRPRRPPKGNEEGLQEGNEKVH